MRLRPPGTTLIPKPKPGCKGQVKMPPDMGDG
jgi:hypothetical protein